MDETEKCPQCFRIYSFLWPRCTEYEKDGAQINKCIPCWIEQERRQKAEATAGLKES